MRIRHTPDEPRFEPPQAEPSELGGLTLGAIFAQLGQHTDLAQLGQHGTAPAQAAPQPPTIAARIASAQAENDRLRAEAAERDRADAAKFRREVEETAREAGRAYGRGEAFEAPRPLPENETEPERAQRCAFDQLAAQARAEGQDYARRTTGGK